MLKGKEKPIALSNLWHSYREGTTPNDQKT